MALSGASPCGVGAALCDQVQPPGTVTAPAVAQPLQLPALLQGCVYVLLIGSQVGEENH